MPIRSSLGRADIGGDVSTAVEPSSTCVVLGPSEEGSAPSSSLQTLVETAGLPVCLDMRELVFKACAISVWEKFWSASKRMRLFPLKRIGDHHHFAHENGNCKDGEKGRSGVLRLWTWQTIKAGGDPQRQPLPLRLTL
ncbi:unnamed protein product [Tetraodon nigroviridis]|uniref:(spotted green pufferfish) hypothetical protein n=1 Tax=Tetraodon nigroviridis TaxID=99883 RepID=Q4T629_TETNG|nr:unnamed protein product [Tetraodon nigroviridis]